MMEKRCFWFIAEIHKHQSEYGYFLVDFYGYHKGSIRIPSDKYLVVRLKMGCYDMKAGIEKIISVRELYRIPVKLLKDYASSIACIMNEDAKREFKKKGTP